MPGVEFGYTQPIQMRVDELVSGVKSQIALKVDYGQQRSLVESQESEAGTCFFLQNVISEHLTQRLVHAAKDEIVAGEVALRRGDAEAAVARVEGHAPAGVGLASVVPSPLIWSRRNARYSRLVVW